MSRSSPSRIIRSYKSSTKSVKAQPVKYVKERTAVKRRVPKTVQRKRRIVKRVVECEPVGAFGGMAAHHGSAYAGAAAGAGAEHGAPIAHGNPDRPGAERKLTAMACPPQH